jgi:hypothetical protein
MPQAAGGKSVGPSRCRLGTSWAPPFLLAFRERAGSVEVGARRCPHTGDAFSGLPSHSTASFYACVSTLVDSNRIVFRPSEEWFGFRLSCGICYSDDTQEMDRAGASAPFSASPVRSDSRVCRLLVA